MPVWAASISSLGKRERCSGVTVAGSSAFWGLLICPEIVFRGRGQYLTLHGYSLLSSLELFLFPSSLPILSLSFSLLSYLLSAPSSALHFARWDLSPSASRTHDILLKMWTWNPRWRPFLLTVSFLTGFVIRNSCRWRPGSTIARSVCAPLFRHRIVFICIVHPAPLFPFCSSCKKTKKTNNFAKHI